VSVFAQAQGLLAPSSGVSDLSHAACGSTGEAPARQDWSGRPRLHSAGGHGYNSGYVTTRESEGPAPRFASTIILSRAFRWRWPLLVSRERSVIRNKVHLLRSCTSAARRQAEILASLQPSHVGAAWRHEIVCPQSSPQAGSVTSVEGGFGKHELMAARLSLQRLADWRALSKSGNEMALGGRGRGSHRTSHTARVADVSKALNGDRWTPIRGWRSGSSPLLTHTVNMVLRHLGTAAARHCIERTNSCGAMTTNLGKI